MTARWDQSLSDVGKPEGAMGETAHPETIDKAHIVLFQIIVLSCAIACVLRGTTTASNQHSSYWTTRDQAYMQEMQSIPNAHIAQLLSFQLSAREFV